ncbi:hypothetical protein EDD21DRAFT_229548, partial [Dissophora ornata]
PSSIPSSPLLIRSSLPFASLFSLSLFSLLPSSHHCILHSILIPRSLCLSRSLSLSLSVSAPFLPSLRLLSPQTVLDSLQPQEPYSLSRPQYLTPLTRSYTHNHTTTQHSTQMELDEAPAPTSRLDHLAELATSPSHAIVHPPNSSSSTTSSASSSSNSRHSQLTHSQQPAQDDSRNHHPHRSTSPSSSYMRDTRASSPAAHHHSRSQVVQQQLEAESSSGWSRSPITPTTTRKFTRMAIHDVLDGHGRGQGRDDEGENSPPYKRKGSPEDSFSDPPSHSR